MTLSQFVRGFKWDSENQKKSFGSLVKYLDEKIAGGYDTMDVLLAAVAYLIQKDHESNEWWLKLMGDQIKSLEDQIKELQNKDHDREDQAD